MVTEAQPPGDQWDDTDRVWMACAYVKSNAVILVKDGVACSIGAGRQNRCDSGRLAGEKAEGRSAGVVYASDAFFPLSDGRDGASSAGATTFQPGCSMGDQKVVDRADEAGRPWSLPADATSGNE